MNRPTLVFSASPSTLTSVSRSTPNVSSRCTLANVVMKSLPIFSAFPTVLTWTCWPVSCINCTPFLFKKKKMDLKKKEKESSQWRSGSLWSIPYLESLNRSTEVAGRFYFRNSRLPVCSRFYTLAAPLLIIELFIPFLKE